MIDIKEVEMKNQPKILIIGVGGGGNNAVNRMINASVSGVSFAAVNTDIFVLEKSLAEKRIQIGEKLLKGYGAGADPGVGESAAIESEEEILSLVEEMNMVIITCGMGGGTGTGAAPVIAKICREMDILTLAIVTLPFSFESSQRMTAAKQGLERLKEYVDTLLVIPNDKLLGLSEKPLLLDAAFEMADSVLKDAIETIANIVYNGGTINIDYNDLKTTFSGKGQGHLGVGIVGSDKTALDAVKQAVNSPLLDTSIEGADVLLVNTCGRVDINAINDAISYLTDLTGKDTRVIWGTVHPENIDEDKIIVTIIATGMAPKNQTSQVPKPVPQADPLRLKVPPAPTARKTGELQIPVFLRAYSSQNPGS